MKKQAAAVAGIVLCAVALLAGCSSTKRAERAEKTITISGAWALYPMAVKWAEEYGKLHPEVSIDVSAGGAGKGMADALSGVVDIGMVSRDIDSAEIEKGAWWVSVVKDSVVVVVNETNPHIDKLLSGGAKREPLIGMWIKGEVKTWGEITGDGNGDPIHVYTRSDACGAAETLAKYLGGKQEDMLGVGVYGDPGLAEAVRKDALGIGFNNINFAYDAATKKPVKGLRVLPLDLNADGAITAEEDFYGDRDSMAAAIADGRYPAPPSRDLHFVTKGKPQREVVADFLKWTLTDGGKFVTETGYIELPEDRIAAELEKLEGK